jgi:hypothetical protein
VTTGILSAGFRLAGPGHPAQNPGGDQSQQASPPVQTQVRSIVFLGLPVRATGCLSAGGQCCGYFNATMYPSFLLNVDPNQIVKTSIIFQSWIRIRVGVKSWIRSRI